MRRVRTIAVAMVLSLSGAAAHAEDVITHPDWLRKPTAEDMRGVWPTAALKSGASGKASIKCSVSDQGLLYDCRVLVDEPPGGGFGAAAILMAPQFVMRPMTRNGKVVGGGTVTIPFNFVGSGAQTFGPISPMVRPTIAWERAPTRAEVAAVYPEKARAANVAGVVGLQCGFTYLRTLKDCRTLAEAPRGYGFASAAERVTRVFVAAPMKPGGLPLSDAMIQLSVAFTPELLRPDSDVAGKPNWAALPSDESLDKSFANLPPGVSSLRVVMRCIVQQGGSLADCRTISEEPAGQGFGARAMALTPEFKLSTWTMEGLPVVGSAVNIPLRYKAADAPAPKP